MKKFLVLLNLSFPFLLFSCVPIDQTGQSASAKKLVLADHVYEDQIRTVRLYRYKGSEITDVLEPAAIHIRQDRVLMLEFDELYGEATNYRAKIIPCNYNWGRAQINDLEFLFDFNEFNITDYQISINTKVPYVHYRFSVPKVKLPGNYVIVVYREGNAEDIVLSRRFLVYDDKVLVETEIGLSSDVELSRTNQQLEFLINYKNYQILNPMEEIKIVIRQNQRWDNALFSLKPSFIREDINELEYRQFNLENNFPAGNEFRFFDLRTINFLGQNVDKIERKKDGVEAFLFWDKDRSGQAYSEVLDINGKYIIENRETGGGKTESEYANVHFFLASEQLPQEIYLFGELTNWGKNSESRMTYDPEIKGYTTTLLLKQGWYDYIYFVPNNGKHPYPFDGSHFQTGNQYEILVYHKPLGARTDYLIGYSFLDYNNRRR